MSATDAASRVGPLAPGTATVRDVVGAYVGLTKPRIIELLLVTTVPAMFLAAGGVPPLGLVLATMLGGCLAAASANAFNCVLDRDIDERMRRTRRRPLPRHVVAPRAATIFGAVCGIAATVWLGLLVNWLSALLALGANAFYIGVYTAWLKRRTPQNIVWGGIAGCFPPLIGWTAVTGALAWPPLVLFAIVFFWTPPHTWALAIRYRDDYAAADVPMLPVVRPPRTVARQILAYAVITVGVSLLLWPVAGTGWLYPTVAAVAGAALVVEAVQLLRRAEQGLPEVALRPMRLFHWSNSYLALVFVAAAVDPLLR
ncbi:MAG: heme o synthase [Actinomycetes bacterium]